MAIPCKDCLMVPACRHKSYKEIIQTCDPLHYTLYTGRSTLVGNRVDDFVDKIRETEHILGGIKWRARMNEKNKWCIEHGEKVDPVVWIGNEDTL